MTLLDMLNAHGRLELSLVKIEEGKAEVKLERGGDVRVVQVEDVRFQSGGAVTLFHTTTPLKVVVG